MLWQDLFPCPIAIGVKIKYNKNTETEKKGRMIDMREFWAGVGVTAI